MGRRRRLLRILLNAATAVSLVLCVAALALALLGTSGWNWERKRPQSLIFAFGPTPDHDGVGLLWAREIPAADGSWYLKEREGIWGSYRSGWWSPFHVRHLVIRWWVFAAIGTLAATRLIWTWYGWRRPSGPRDPLCPACGYDLRATPDRCPECGTMPTAAPPAR